jgi:hypothetical protein
MSTRRLLTILVVLAAGPAIVAPHAQSTAPSAPKKKNPLLKLAQPWEEPAVLEARRTEAQQRPLFQSNEPLSFSLAADFKTIEKDRKPDSDQRYPAVITVTDARGREQTLHVRVSPRGHLRRMARTCDFVPLRVEFNKNEVAGGVFDGETTLKLGTHCRDENEFDQYVMREYLSYRLQNLVTPQSFRARLARGTYVDAASGKRLTTRYALWLENDNDVARRLGGRIVELQRLTFNDVDAAALQSMTVFNYMIGNTDFSLYALHNVKLVQDPSRVLYPVPYDFDISGFVNPPYAAPDRRLGIRTVSDRLYRGPCTSGDEMETTAAAFRVKHDAMFTTLDDFKEIDGRARSEAKDYLDGFFKSIASQAAVKKTFVDGCKATPTM